MDDLAAKTTTELEELRSRLQEDLDEVEEERDIVLSQTGVHISASVVARYEAERSSLKTRLDEVERALRDRSGGKG